MSYKLKNKPVEFTTHRLGIQKVRAALEAIPKDQRTKEQMQILANMEADEQGVITIRDVIEAKGAPGVVEPEVIPPPPGMMTVEEKKKPGRKKGAKSGKVKKG